MRLINVHTGELHEFVDPPPYAILSHRWTGNEITFQQYLDPEQRYGAGYEKVAKFCSYAAQNYALEWAWADTCCIDKKSSAELSEAINSMWTWYWNSEICIAYLEDATDESPWHHSQWFDRGWTLQELLAPRNMIFCNRDWQKIGSKKSIAFRKVLESKTGIPERYLMHRTFIWETSITRRMSWASRRRMTRPEDVAYSLFGLFQINLPLLYGEGGRAFLRLQEEIVRSSDDETILAWSSTNQTNTESSGILAPHPGCFADSGELVPAFMVDRPPLAITSRGLQIETELVQVQFDLYLLQLNCGSVTSRVRHRSVDESLGREINACMIPLTTAKDRVTGTGDITIFQRSHVNSCDATARQLNFDPRFSRRSLPKGTQFIQTTSILRSKMFSTSRLDTPHCSNFPTSTSKYLWKHGHGTQSYFDALFSGPQGVRPPIAVISFPIPTPKTCSQITPVLPPSRPASILSGDLDLP